MMNNMTGNIMYQQIQPIFKQFAVGKGIDQNEYNSIIQAAKNAYKMRLNPLSGNIIKGIKGFLGGEWFVLVSPIGSNAFDFCLSCVTGGDSLSFSLDNTMFQICRLRD